MTWQGLPEGDKDLCLSWAEEKLNQVHVYKALLTYSTAYAHISSVSQPVWTLRDMLHADVPEKGTVRIRK